MWVINCVSVDSNKAHWWFPLITPTTAAHIDSLSKPVSEFTFFEAIWLNYPSDAAKEACEVWKHPPDDDVHVIILSNLYPWVNCPEHCQVQPAASPDKNMTNSFWEHNPHLCSEWVMTCGLLCRHFLSLFTPTDLWVQVEGVHVQTLPPILHRCPILRKLNILIIVSHVTDLLLNYLINNDEFGAGRTRPTRVPLLK